MFESQPSERAAVVGTIDPVDVNNTSTSSDNLDMSLFREGMFILQTGVMAASSTLDAKLQESVNGTSGWQDITGKSMTQMVNTDDNKQVVFNIKAEELSAGYRYVKLLLTPSAHSILASAVVLGMKPAIGPANDNDISSVAQIVT